MKNWIRAAVLVAAVLLLAGCPTQEESAETPRERDLPRLNRDLADGELRLEHVLQEGNKTIVLESFYSTDYDMKSWRITDSKTIKFGIRVKQTSETAEVFVEHVHVDVTLDARKAGADGMPQDSMDDSIHGGQAPGFLITPVYPYEEVFSIEGVNQTLISGWGWVSGDTGHSHLAQKRLTEKNLREAGQVVANKFTFIYDIVIKYGDEPHYHKRIVAAEFMVPIG